MSLFLDYIINETSKDPLKWRSSGAKCFLYSPSYPAFFTCRYNDKNGIINISISTVDINGNTIKEEIANKIDSPFLFQKFNSFYEDVKNISQKNANEQFFKTMVQSYNPPDIFNNKL